MTSKAEKQRAALIPVLAEIFRAYGYEGASLSRISEGTGLGKGSLYKLFPGGKDEMVNAVLADIDDWFQRRVFRPLLDMADARAGVDQMFVEVEGYFLSGHKVCLLGVLALVNVRDRFAEQVKDYFVDWAQALQAALQRCGIGNSAATDLSETILAGIQGALVLARALDDASIFGRCLARLQQQLPSPVGRDQPTDAAP